MIRFVTSSVDFSVTEYIIHSPRNMTPTQHEHLWQYQAMIISDCRRRRSLNTIISHVNDTSPKSLVQTFNEILENNGWLFSSRPVYYPDCGNSIDSPACITLGICSNTRHSEAPQLILPPVTVSHPIESYIPRDLHKEDYVLSWSLYSVLFRDKFNIFEARPVIFKL